MKSVIETITDLPPATRNATYAPWKASDKVRDELHVHVAQRIKNLIWEPVALEIVSLTNEEEVKLYVGHL